jgi:hypothetical protein
MGPSIFEERQVSTVRALPWTRLVLSGLIVVVLASPLVVVGLATRGASYAWIAVTLGLLAGFVVAVLTGTYVVRILRGETLHFGVPPLLDRQRNRRR